MSSVDTLRGLLLDALQDLYEGEAVACARLPALVRATDSAALADVLRERSTAAEGRVAALEALARGLDGKARGPKNLWMSAMFEDADRDIRTVAHGPLRDAALVGAVRKMATAAAVSYETALAVAERLGEAGAAQVFGAARDAERASDETLRDRLFAAVASAGAG